LFREFGEEQGWCRPCKPLSDFSYAALSCKDGRCRRRAGRPHQRGERGARAERKEKADCGRREMLQRYSFRHQSFGEA
jgi:hypothetical protein